MELQEEVKRGGLYWLREELELLWLEVREGWNMDSEWVRETLALFLNTAMTKLVLCCGVVGPMCGVTCCVLKVEMEESSSYQRLSGGGEMWGETITTQPQSDSTPGQSHGDISSWGRN